MTAQVIGCRKLFVESYAMKVIFEKPRSYEIGKFALSVVARTPLWT